MSARPGKGQPRVGVTITCAHCGGDCRGAFDLIRIGGRNVPVCKGACA